MIQGLYTIFDRPAQQHSAPFIARNDAVALRQYSHYKGTIPPHVPPEDFVLIEIATMDDETGMITPIWPVRDVAYQPPLDNQHA